MEWSIFQRHNNKLEKLRLKSRCNDCFEQNKILLHELPAISLLKQIKIFTVLHLLCMSSAYNCINEAISWLLCHVSLIRWDINVRPYLPLQISIHVLYDPIDMVTKIASFMVPTWGPPGSCRPQMGPMLAPWTMLSGKLMCFYFTLSDISGTHTAQLITKMTKDSMLDMDQDWHPTWTIWDKHCDCSRRVNQQTGWIPRFLNG